MSQPVPTKHPSFAAHAVSTPQAQMTQATTPRSVPSPAIHRSSAATVPAASSIRTPSSIPNHQGLTTSSKSGQSSNINAMNLAGGGTAMALSLSQISNTSGFTPSAVTGGSGLGIGGLLAATSRANNLLSFASPNALAGMDLGTPSLLDHATSTSNIGSAGALMGGTGMSLSAVGGQAMNLTLSDLGISSRRNEDDERRGRLEAVLGRLVGGDNSGVDGKTTRKRKRAGPGMGRVSDEGVRRIGRWAGFDVEVDPKWEGKEFEGNRPVIIAGRNAVLIDMVFKDNAPQTIEVSCSSEDEAVVAGQADAAKVLLDDLRPGQGVSVINARLDGFAQSLSLLSRLDKLSSRPLNCFEVMTGLHSSLQRLCDHEQSVVVETLGPDVPNREAKIERLVTCKKSGRPRMHQRGKLGLGIDYWETKRASSTSDKTSTAHNTNQIFSLEISAERSDASLYPSLRKSSDWLSERVVKPTEETTDPSDLISGKPIIDWLDPPQTFVNETSDTTMAVDGPDAGSKLPEARFVAHLDPPLVMVWSAAAQILQAVASPSMPTADQLNAYDTLLRIDAGADAMEVQRQQQQQQQQQQQMGPISVARRTTTVPGRGRKGEDEDEEEGEENFTHRNALYVPKQEYAYRLAQIPFSHPRQLIDILPLLRQWAFVSSLLRDAVLDDDGSGGTPAAAVPRTKAGTSSSPMNSQSSDSSSAGLLPQVSLSELLDEDRLRKPSSRGAHNDSNGGTDNGVGISTSTGTGTGAGNSNDINIDMILSTSPIPSLAFIFPLDDKTRLAEISLNILPDGDIVVTGQNVIETKLSSVDDGDVVMDSGDGVNREQQQLGRALSICQDVGVWVEWIRQKHGSRD